MKIQQIKAKHLASGRIHYFNLGTWNHHQRIQRESGVKIYKVMQIIKETGGNKVLSRGLTAKPQAEITPPPMSRGITAAPPPPKRKKKGCNC